MCNGFCIYGVCSRSVFKHVQTLVWLSFVHLLYWRLKIVGVMICIHVELIKNLDYSEALGEEDSEEFWV